MHITLLYYRASTFLFINNELFHRPVGNKSARLILIIFRRNLKKFENNFKKQFFYLIGYVNSEITEQDAPYFVYISLKYVYNRPSFIQQNSISKINSSSINIK